MKLTDKQKELLESPLPNQAISTHPTKNYLSTIKPIYISERLNEVFGLGGWYTTQKMIDRIELKENVFHVVLEVVLHIPSINAEFTNFGGNDNGKDLGDAYKGAVSDAISKICATHLHIGLDVYKGERKPYLGEKELGLLKKAVEVKKPEIDIQLWLSGFLIETHMREKVIEIKPEFKVW